MPTATRWPPPTCAGTCASSGKTLRRQSPGGPERGENQQGGDEEGELQRFQLRIFIVGDERVGAPPGNPFGLRGFADLIGGDEAAAGAELDRDLLLDPV